MLREIISHKVTDVRFLSPEGPRDANSRAREWMAVSGLVAGGGGGVLVGRVGAELRFAGVRVSVWDNEKVLEMDGGGVWMAAQQCERD